MLSDGLRLSTIAPVKSPGWPPFEDVTTFLIAMLLMGFSFYGLLFAPDASMTESDHLLFAGIITSVATWAFQRNATKQASKHALDAQNGPMTSVRQALADLQTALAEVQRKQQ